MRLIVLRLIFQMINEKEEVTQQGKMTREGLI